MGEPKFQVNRVQGAPVSTDEILSDLKSVSGKLGTPVLSQKAYSECGKFNPSTVSRRFGSWNKAIEAAGLEPANELNISDERLYENIMRLWEYYGRQPRRSELAKPPSMISWGAYRRRFHGWIDALSNFVAYANSGELSVPNVGNTPRASRPPREPSLRSRFRVLKRDNFRCVSCGASPALTPGLSLHVDHIIPWSRGGETLEDNLQTLCQRCNLGKSNIL